MTRVVGARMLHWWLFTAACLLVAAGCGPIRATQRINEAKVSFERARVAAAYEKAPYEYFSAQYYLHKAEEEWGYSDFQAAFDFAEEAEQAAESARRKAKEDPWKDPVEGRGKSYDVSPRETITADPSRIRKLEETRDERESDREGERRAPPAPDSSADEGESPRREAPPTEGGES